MGAWLTHLGSSSPVSIHAHRCPLVVCAHHSSWVMVKGVGGHHCLCAVVMVVVACVPSWALGISCGWWRLIVVILGWGGVVSRPSNESLGHVLACDVACHVVVVVVGGGCEQMGMVVGGGGC